MDQLRQRLETSHTSSSTENQEVKSAWGEKWIVEGGWINKEYLSVIDWICRTVALRQKYLITFSTNKKEPSTICTTYVTVITVASQMVHQFRLINYPYHPKICCICEGLRVFSGVDSSRLKCLLVFVSKGWWHFSQVSNSA